MIDVSGLLIDLAAEIESCVKEADNLEDEAYAQNCGRIEALQKTLDKLRALMNANQHL